MLKPIFIGNIEIKNPIMLAPMAGVSDPPYRERINMFGGLGLMFSEMIPSKSLFFGNKNKNQNKAKSNFDINAIQIAGNDPYYMAEAAKINVDLGADIIDINFGCPVKKVVKGFAGSALMKDEKLASEIIKSVVNAVNVPVTVKMRLGWDFDNLNAKTIAKIAEDNGVKMVTVHGRTRSQLYEGKANWKLIGEVKNSVKIPVIANGDIKTVDDVKKCLEESNADGVMIGRGSYGKPWIFKEISSELNGNNDFKKPTISELKDIIFKHLELVTAYYGEKESLLLFRKHLGWYSHGMNGSSDFRNKINRIKSIEEVKKEINDFFK